jgi:hypothetical protein
MVRGIELKFFSHILDTILRGHFFLFQNILLWGFLAAVTTFALVKKQALFRVSSILAFFSNDKRFKGKKNVYPPQTVSSICKKMFSSIGHSISERGVRKVRSF